MTTLSELFPAGGGGNTSDFVASGTLPNGKPVILKANGQVEVVGVSVTPTSISSTSTVDSGALDGVSVEFDPHNANKFLVGWVDGGSSWDGALVVGTVSGTSLSFGTTYYYETASITGLPKISFDKVTPNKAVVAYAVTSNNGKAIVITLSGNSLSFGAKATYHASNVTWPDIAFDPHTAGRFAICWQRDSNAYVIIGNYTNTSISYGSMVQYNSDSSYGDISWNPFVENEFVIAYKADNNSSYGTIKRMTVSGTVLSNSTATVFNSAATRHFPKVQFDPNTSGRFVLAYAKGSGTETGYIKIGTLSGSTFSFGSAATFNSGNTFTFDLAVATKPSNRFVVTYNIVGSDTAPKFVVGTINGTSSTISSATTYASGENYYAATAFDPSTTGSFVHVYGGDWQLSTANRKTRAMLGVATYEETNLTTSNFLGTATAAYTNGQTASIMLKGGISDNQTSLTAGSTYYVQPAGTFATSAGTPSVIAGKAVSATSLLLNGLATPDEIPSQSGNTGKFLTTDGSAASWGTVAGGWVPIDSVTASSSSSVLLEGITSDYDSYAISVNGIDPSTNSYLMLRVKYNGTIQTSNYGYYIWYGSNNQYAGDYSESSDAIYMCSSNAAPENTMSGMIYIAGTETGKKFASYSSIGGSTSTSQAVLNTGSGAFSSSSYAITGVQLRPNTGTFTSGSFTLYGLAKP